MSDSNMNPMGDIYSSFLKVLETITIKYVSKAEEFETLETKQSADAYIQAVEKTDTFDTYIDYTLNDYIAVGLNDSSIIDQALKGDTSVVPKRYRDQLLQIRRQRVLDNFEEKNNYYRCLNGYPNVEDTDYFYVSDELVTKYGFDKSVPIHKIQDYYNKELESRGDYMISILEGNGYLEKLYKANPDKTYLKYLGSNRISIVYARRAKNFQILQLFVGHLKQSFYDQFAQTYEQCREYFVKTIYVRDYRSFIEYYDNLIALSIMVMTIQQIIMKQISLGVKREFFNIVAVKALYLAYDIPFNLNIDEETQTDLIQNLNLLIQDKATNKVIYNIANLLGFSNVNVYKYFLTKERKFDSYGVPIVAYKEKFNTDTGEVEIVPDYEKMYDVYFQKSDLNNEDYMSAYNAPVNRVDYEDVVKNDAFWWEDENTLKHIWETEYNMVESKYLSLGISYSMTDIMFDNILLLKMIMEKEEEIDDIRLTLPRILENTPVSLFDTIILLICLTACKHNLKGEIITIPTQVIHVLDYMRNVEQTDMLVDTFSFDFSYFSKENQEGQEHLLQMKDLLCEEDYNRFMNYVSILSFNPDITSEEKITTLNEMYSNIKNLYKFLNYQMTITHDRKTYEILKTMYNALYYAREVRDTFTISGQTTGVERTAWSYFEYLYHRNPKLYNAVFTVSIEEQYNEYLVEKGLVQTDLPYTEFLEMVENGEIKIRYSTLLGEVIDDENVKGEKIYYYVNHILSRLEMIIKDTNYLYLMNDSATPLEELLMKLVRHFKSYTVDVIGFDTLYVCDLKSENLLRLFDEIAYMEKTIGIDERIKLSYSDIVHRIIENFKVSDKLTWEDKMYYTSLLLIDNSHGIYNSVRLRDELSMYKESLLEEKVSFYDTFHSLSEDFDVKEKFKMKDGIVAMWYSDEETE